MSETIVIPAAADIFPNSDGSESGQKLLKKVMDALRQFKSENVYSLSTVCKVACSGFPFSNIAFVAAELKAAGHHVQIQKCYWEKGLDDPCDYDGWCLYLRISSQPFPPVKPLQWWQLMFYSIIRPTSYIAC